MATSNGYGERLSVRTNAESCPESRSRRFSPEGVAIGFFTCCLVLFVGHLQAVAGESNSLTLISTGRVEETNFPLTAQALSQLEGQVRSNQLAIELSSREAKQAAARNSEALAAGLKKIEDAFAAQREVLSALSARELEALQRSNRDMLVVASSFAAVALLAMVVIAFLQWRMTRVWSGLTTMFPLRERLGQRAVLPELGPGGQTAVGGGAVEDSNRRLLGAVEKLERRVGELEQTSEPGSSRRLMAPGPKNGNGDSGHEDDASGGGHGETSASDEEVVIGTLLAQGKTKLKENELDAALKCFDEVLALDPDNGEALVKKGSTLERMHKLNEAFECYDRAIAADDSLTLAYLHKGGLCNRLERFKEALECYEKALRTHDE